LYLYFLGVNIVKNYATPKSTTKNSTEVEFAFRH